MQKHAESKEEQHIRLKDKHIGEEQQPNSVEIDMLREKPIHEKEQHIRLKCKNLQIAENNSIFDFGRS